MAGAVRGFAAEVVDALHRVRIVADAGDFQRVRLERCSVEHVKLLRELAVAEFRAEEIAGREERFPRAVWQFASDVFDGPAWRGSSAVKRTFGFCFCCSVIEVKQI